MNVKLKLGIIGLGARGSSLLKYVVLPMCEDNIELVSLCDVYEDRVNAAAEEAWKRFSGKRPFATTDSEKVLPPELMRFLSLRHGNRILISPYRL